MGSEWQEFRLSDAVHLIGGGTPKRSHPEYWGGPIPWLSVKDFNNDFRHVEFSEESITELGLAKSSANILTEGQLVISARGTVGALAQVSNRMAFNQSCYGIDARTGYAINDFLYYLIKYSIANFRQITHGAVFDTITRETFDHILIQLPSLPVQKAITHILGSLDDKIELNRKMNETLEAMAQALFKSWFVDFDPVIDNALAAGNPIPDDLAERAAMREALGDLSACLPEHNSQSGDHAQAGKLKSLPEHIRSLFPAEFQLTDEMGPTCAKQGAAGRWIPKGWKASAIGNEVDCVGGATPSTKKAEFWDDGDIHWTTPKDLSHLDARILPNTDRKITESGLKKISSGLLPVDTVLMSSRAPVGYLALAKIPVAVNQGYIAMKCNKRLTSEYVIQWASSVMDDIKQRAGGTTFAEISKKNFRSIPIIVPGKGPMEVYSKKVQSFYDKTTGNLKETVQLKVIRDSLLPRLLSGDRRVLDFDVTHIDNRGE